MPKRKVHRSAVTGKLVTKEFAEANPATTVSQTVDVPVPEKVAREPKPARIARPGIKGS